MRLLILLFASLMLATNAWGSAAHGANIGCDDAPASMAVHSPDDCGQVPADAGKGYAHCHAGCHGQSVTAPVLEKIALMTRVVSRSYIAAALVAPTAHNPDRILRPPIT